MRFDGKGNKVSGPGRLIYKKDKNLLIYSEVDLGQEMTIEVNPDKSEIERVGSYITKFRFAYKFRDNPQLFLFTVGSGKPIDTSYLMWKYRSRQLVLTSDQTAWQEGSTAMNSPLANTTTHHEPPERKKPRLVFM